MVRKAFEAYLEKKSLSAAAAALNGKGWRMKEWANKSGGKRGGSRFFRVNLSQTLRNAIYTGKRRYKGELYKAEHAAIIDEETFWKAQEIMAGNRVKRGSPGKDKHDFLLKGLVRCAACGSPMTPHFASKRGHLCLYYRCSLVNRSNREACPVRAVRARALEQFVIEQIKVLAQDPEILEGLVRRSAEEDKELPGLRQEKVAVSSELGRLEVDIRGAMSGLGASPPGSATWKALMDGLDGMAARREELRARLAQVEAQILEAETRHVDAEMLKRNLGAFVEVFERLDPLQKKEFIRLLIKEIVYDKPQSLVRLGLIPFQGFEWPIDRFSVGLDACINWLPESDSFQNVPRIKKPFVLWHRSTYQVILERRGRRKMVDSEAYQARQLILAKRVREPRPPLVQVLLRKAYAFDERLKNTPGLTQEALAREEHVDPSRITQIMRLLKLDPVIQQRILAMPPSTKRGVTEHSIRRLFNIPDLEHQHQEFQRLLSRYHQPSA